MTCCGKDGDAAGIWGPGCFRSSPSLIDRFKVPLALPDFLKTCKKEEHVVDGN